MPGCSTPMWIVNPLDVITGTFETLDLPQADAQKFRQLIEETFADKLGKAELDQRYLVPWINGKSQEELSAIPAGSLVRYRCMLFDEEPVFYHQSFVEVKHRVSGQVTQKCAMFQDTLKLGEEEDIIAAATPQSLCELQSFKCGEPPGENDWIRQRYQSKPSSKSLLPLTNSPVITATFFADAGKNLRLHDTLEIFGVLTPPESTEVANATGDDFLEEAVPQSRFCISAIYFDKLLHSHPSLPNNREGILNALPTVTEVRRILLDALTKCLLGDELAAEYLLLHLISSIQSRADGLPVGNFPLNICYAAADEHFVKKIHFLLHHLLAKMVTFSLNITSLNTARMVPKIDVDAVKSELIPGILQLSKQTHLVLDEAEMTAGTLNETGVKNVMALQRLTKSQVLEMDYFNQSVEFEMDIPVLVISQSRSLLSVRYIVPIVINNPQQICDISEIPEETLSLMRDYLVAVKFIDYEIEEEVRESIVEKFVEMRKANKAMSGDDLHDQLEVARYLVLSHGHSRLTTEKWTRVMQMENDRRNRLTTNRSLNH